MTSHQIEMLFVDLALVLVLGRALAAAGRRFGQPPVIGEIVAGVLLGPTLFHGALSAHLVPLDVRPLLGGMADVGVVLFMFCVGLELEAGALREGKAALVVRVAAMATVVPFALGVAIAVPVLRGHAGGERAGSILFVGLSLAVTAFPVLARILTDRALISTPLGSIALSAAAVVDIVAWVGLAALQAALAGSGGAWGVSLMIPFTAAMFLVVRPVLGQVFLTAANSGSPRAPQAVFVSVVVGALLAGAATQAMGMQFIFGAFLFGAAVPRTGTGAPELREHLLERTIQVTAVFLPVYFVVAGLNVDLGRLSAGDLARLAAINVVAVAGKLAGTYAAARWRQTLPRRDASALALLMNTRGLTEMVILGIGLQMGLLDGTVYSLMVAMAVLTTAMAGPLLSRVRPRPVLVGSVSAVPPRTPHPKRVEQADGLLVHTGEER